MSFYTRHTTLLLLSLWLIVSLSACSDEQPRLHRLGHDAVILAFGDSLTHGNGAKPDASYPAVLEQISGHRVVNAGVPGEVSAEGLARLPEILDEYEPSLLILCHGGNDILRKQSRTAMAANLRDMIELARERNIDVILLGVPEFNLFNRSSLPFYAELASRFEIPYEGEIIPEIEYTQALKADPIHPNAAGYRRMAEAIHQLLKNNGAL